MERIIEFLKKSQEDRIKMFSPENFSTLRIGVETDGMLKVKDSTDRVLFMVDAWGCDIEIKGYAGLYIMETTPIRQKDDEIASELFKKFRDGFKSK